MNSKQFLKEGFLEDAHEAHSDHEVQMARVDCYYAAEHAIVLHKLLRNISEEQGLEGWVASKITLANDYLKSVREHLEYQMMNVDADQDDFLPFAEGKKPTKKKLSESSDIQEFERGPWYIIISGEAVPDKDGTPRKFNWLNAAKSHFRKMLNDDPKVAEDLKKAYNAASDKKTVIYYSKKLPNNTNTQKTEPEEKVSETSDKPGLWANIRAKRARIKSGSGEKMRKPGSKGAPSDKDLKSIRASSVKENWRDDKFADNDLLRGPSMMPKYNYNFKTPEPKSREELLSRLKELEAEFDPAYQQSDDYGFWSKQNKIQSEIVSIKRQLEKQGVAEGSGPQVGDEVYYGNRLVGWFKGYSKYGKFITKPNVDEMGDEYWGRDVYWEPQKKITIKPKQGVAEGYKNTYNVGDRVDGPLGTGTIVAVSKNVNVDGRVKVKLDDPSRAGEDGKYKDSFVLNTTQLKHIDEQGVAEGSLNEFSSDSEDDGYYKEYLRGYKDGKGYPEVVKSSKKREIWMTVTPKNPPLTEPYMRGWYDGKYGPAPGKDLIDLNKLSEQGVAEESLPKGFFNGRGFEAARFKEQGNMPMYHAAMSDQHIKYAKHFAKTNPEKAKWHGEQSEQHIKQMRASQKQGVAEEIKGWKHAGRDLAQHRASLGKDVHLVSLKKDGTESKMNDAKKSFRSEDEARQYHERIKKLNPTRNIRHNLYVGDNVEKLD